MTTEVINACPTCDSSGVLFRDGNGLYYVECPTCDYRTDGMETMEEAVNLWNEDVYFNVEVL